MGAVILIGSFDSTPIECLDAQDNGRDIFRIENFGPAEFDQLEDRVRNKTCTGRFENPQGIRPNKSDAWVYANGETGLGPVLDGGGGNGTGCKPNCDATAEPTKSPVNNLAFTNQLFAQEKGQLSDKNDWNNQGIEPNHVEFDREHNDATMVEHVEVGFDESVYIAVWLMCGLILLCSLAIAWKCYDIDSKPAQPESIVESMV